MTRPFLRAAAWLAAILAILAALGWWRYQSLDLDSIPKANQHATPAGQPYLKQALTEKRGRILAIVSSAERGGPLNKNAGYELTAFLNDAEAQSKVNRSLPLARVDASRYDAVYIVGGKGAMFDLPGNRDVSRIATQPHER